MSRIALAMLAAALLLSGAPYFAVAQQAPTAEEKPKAYANYEELFEDFQKSRNVLLTRYERLREKERIEPAELEAVENEMRALDRQYAAALRAYIDGHADAKDVMSARFELAVTWSRLPDSLDRAIATADEFLEKHPDSELVADARFLKAQTLFQIAGRESDCVAAIEAFIEKHADRAEIPAVRVMRVRALLFLDRVDDAKRSLKVLLDSSDVKKDEEAREFLQAQLDNLGWIGRELPDFDLPMVGGGKASRADFAGKPLILIVYDSTSSACLGELPFIQQAHKKFGEKLGIFGISVNESRTAFEQWLERNKEKIAFKNAWIDREAENTLTRKLDVSLIPFNVLVNGDGKIYRYDVRSDDMLRYAELLAK